MPRARPDDPRTVVAVQTAPAFGEVEANLDVVERLLDGVRADLVVLPELFATGYSFRTSEECGRYAEPFPEGPTTQRLLAWSERTGGVIVAGLPERWEGRVYNSAAVVAAGRPRLAYRKVHLFGFESELYAPGAGPLPVVEHEGLRVGVMVCFDWIFPEAARRLALDGADVIAHPSNLVLPWCQRAMPTRALENGVYTVTVNRVGREARSPRPALAFTGGSLLVSPRGEVLAEASGTEACLLRATLQPSRARDKTLPSGNAPLNERRPEAYESGLSGA